MVGDAFREGGNREGGQESGEDELHEHLHTSRLAIRYPRIAQIRGEPR